MQVIATIREPIARMYSYFAMQLRFNWSPIGHMGKNPCMQDLLLRISQERAVSAGTQTRKYLFTETKP